MFERARQILDDQGHSGSFELQFVCFRNYDCRAERLLQVSPWEARPENLKSFMAGVDANDGTHWEEAVEIALLHANRQIEDGQTSGIPVSQVILIGDAAPNTLEQVNKGRREHGDQYWTQQNVPHTTWETEVGKLADHKIPVHAFYVIPRAEDAFEKIADATGGHCEYLDVKSSSGAESLTHVVTQRILKDMGGDRLVDAYQAKFVRGYVSDASMSCEQEQRSSGQPAGLSMSTQQ